jgi:hypothetical protein
MLPGDQHPVADSGRLPERPPKTRDAHLKGLGGGGRWTLAPQLVDESLGAQRPVGMDQQQRKQRPLLIAPKREREPVTEHFKRTEDAELH